MAASQEEQDKGRLDQPKDGIPESSQAEKYELPQGYLELVIRLSFDCTVSMLTGR